MKTLKQRALKILQDRINKKNRKRLIEKNRTIIANNCIGGYISHYLGLRFNSPTINLFILPNDYIKMLSDIDKYFSPDAEIVEVAETSVKFPVGSIYGCRIYFMHYTSFDEAVSKWRERCKRIDKDSLYILMTDRDGCTMEDMKAFDSLDYRNKVIFTHKKYQELQSAFYIRGFENDPCVGQLHESMNITGTRYIDQFDYVSFLNQN